MTVKITRRVLAVLFFMPLILLNATGAFAAPGANPQFGPPNSTDSTYGYCALTVQEASVTAGNVMHWKVACRVGNWTTTRPLFGSFQAQIRVSGTLNGSATETLSGRNTVGVTYYGEQSFRTSGQTGTCSSGTCYVLGSTNNDSSHNTNTSTTGVCETSPGVNAKTCLFINGSTLNQVVAPSSADPDWPTYYWAGGETIASSPTYSNNAYSGPPGTGDDTTSNESGSAATDSCGAWWHVGCWIGHFLKVLFIPSSTVFSTEFNTLKDSLVAHYPFGPIIWGVNAISDSFNAIQTGVIDAGEDCSAGPSFVIPNSYTETPAEVDAQPHTTIPLAGCPSTYGAGGTLD